MLQLDNLHSFDLKTVSNHKMLPADRLGLSKPVCPGGFRHLFNLVMYFLEY
jgi:hypothetical protein